LTLRLVALPDTDGELTHDLGRLEALLLLLQAYDPADEPAPPGLGPAAVAALQRVRGNVLAALRGPGPEIIVADRRFEPLAVHFAQLDDGDLGLVGDAIAALDRSLGHGGHDLAAGALREATAPEEEPADLVAAFTRAHDVLDLRPDDDTRLVAHVVATHPRRLVLTVHQEDAYQRLTERVLTTFR
jgi:hypothetical protein